MLKIFPGSAAVLGALLVLGGPAPGADDAALQPHDVAASPAPSGVASAPGLSPDALTDVVQRYCQSCHNDRRLRGNMSLEGFQVPDAPEKAQLAEKMIVKLRAGMMPPPGARRPGEDTLQALVETLENTIDKAAQGHVKPGGRPFQRLNRAEYAASIKDLLDLDIDPGEYLPPDTKSANFDNIADVQLMSPTLVGAYLTAAADIRHLALGNPHASAQEADYKVTRLASQREHVPGTPFGTRGGMSVNHDFPADGKYVFRVSFFHETTGALFGNGRSALDTPDSPEQIEISIDGERKSLMDIPRFMDVSDPDGVNLTTDSIFITAGPHDVSAAFVKKMEGPVQDLVSPHGWSLASTAIAGTYGILALPHLRDMAIVGPYDPTGVSETPSRDKVFSCRPSASVEARTCAQQIVTRLATRAFRRPLQKEERDGLMALYDKGAAQDGFEEGVGLALEGILASPQFIFRIEPQPERVKPGQAYPLSGVDVASRLSFFLWGQPPDDALLKDAQAGKLSTAAGVEAEARAMLKDPRASALGTRFAAQWLRLQDLDKVHPDVRIDPDYDQQLADAMGREVELFFNYLVQADRPFSDLFTSNVTFVNERLAKHYGIPGIVGEDFQKVELTDPARQGILGKGAVLTLTSHANRTSPVLRGKWVMEVLMGTPPPPPPPGVPALEETKGAKDGHEITTRERMEMHRASPTCASCHSLIDPIGLALDNFGVTGKWRIRENGVQLDTRGQFYDGTQIESPADLRTVLLKRPIPLIRTFTENLMAYALGRRVEYYDMPTIRQITKEAKADDYRLSSFILGVVKTDAFRMQTAPVVAQDDNERSR